MGRGVSGFNQIEGNFHDGPRRERLWARKTWCMKCLNAQDFRDEAEFGELKKTVERMGEATIRETGGFPEVFGLLDPWRTVLGEDNSLCGGKHGHF